MGQKPTAGSNPALSAKDSHRPDGIVHLVVVLFVPQSRVRRRLAERLLRRAIDTGETLPFEFHHRDAQGEQRELAVTIAPVVTESGERGFLENQTLMI